MNRHERRKAQRHGPFYRLAKGLPPRNAQEAEDMRAIIGAAEGADRMIKGLPPRDAQEAKDMEEAEALVALVDAYVTAPKGPSGDQIRSDALQAARARVENRRS